MRGAIGFARRRQAHKAIPVPRGGTTRDWLKTKVSETGAFVITGFGPREVAVAEMLDGVLVPAGMVSSLSAARICGSGFTNCRAAPPPVPA
jgi:hypothetical protein